MGPNKRFKTYMHMLKRPQISILTQMRTGHIALNYHLHRINKIDTPICKMCDEEKEMVIHFLFRWPGFDRQREILAHETRFDYRSLQALLDHPKNIPAMLRYIAATNRFPNISKRIIPNEAQIKSLAEYFAKKKK